VEKTKYLCTGEEVTPVDLEHGEQVQKGYTKNIST
jgi:hypothetical protein